VSRRPNILVVIADDHQHDAIGALGHPDVQTPCLDGLVQRGTVFEQASIMGSMVPAVCLPTRACLLTGRHLYAANIWPEGETRNPVIPGDACTLPQLFSQAGYETFLTGKWHNDRGALLRSFEKGRSIFFGGMSEHRPVRVRDLTEIAANSSIREVNAFSSDLFADTLCSFVEERERSRPFFAWLAFTSPHDPRTPPVEYRNRYREEELTLPGSFLPEHPFDNGELTVRDECLAPRPRTPEMIRGHLADYYGMISHHDAALGRVIDALSRTGEIDNTIIVYLSDHGLALGRHGLLGKQNLYEHSIRVPFLLSGPGVPATRISTPIYSLDAFATLLELAGLESPPHLESRSLKPIWEGRADVSRETLFAAYRNCQRMVRDERWKLICYRVGEQEERRQLFDLIRDPLELHDRSDVAECAPVIDRLQQCLEEWQSSVGDRWH